MSVMAAVAPMRAHAAVFSGKAQRPHRAVRAARPTVCKAVADPSATAKANKAEWDLYMCIDIRTDIRADVCIPGWTSSPSL